MVIFIVLLFLRKRKESRLLYEKALLLAESQAMVRPMDLNEEPEELEIDEAGEEKNGQTEIHISDELSDKISLGIKTELDENQMYLKHDCNAAMISNQIGTNRTYLNQYCKQEYDATVSEVINNYRVKNILEQLNADTVKRKWTIDKIAAEHGFSSKRTFERAFKIRTGITPVFYIRQLESDV